MSRNYGVSLVSGVQKMLQNISADNFLGMEEELDGFPCLVYFSRWHLYSASFLLKQHGYNKINQCLNT